MHAGIFGEDGSLRRHWWQRQGDEHVGRQPNHPPLQRRGRHFRRVRAEWQGGVGRHVGWQRRKALTGRYPLAIDFYDL